MRIMSMNKEEEITKYETVKNQTTEEYFRGNQFSIDAFKKKYALTENETYVQSLKRVCDFVSSVEKTEELRKYWSERWFDEIYNDWWHPAGSIMQGAGSNKKISLANCTCLSLGKLRHDEEWDNLESIFKNTAYSVAKSAAYRQGLGVDFSRLRPRGANLANSAKESTGAVHWMEFIDKIGYYVGQCLSPNTEILTDVGYKTIQELVESEYSGNVYGKSKKTKIVNWFTNPKKMLYRVKTEYGDYIDASEDHKILIYDIKNDVHVEKPIKDLKIDDYVISRRQTLSTKNDLISLPEFSYQLSEYNNSNRLSVPNKIPTHLTEELAYILGLIYGDGCTYNETIEIAFSNNWPEIYDKFKNCLVSTFGVEVKDYGIYEKIGVKDSILGDCTKITLGKWYYTYFEHLNLLKGKANNLVFPDIMKKCNHNVFMSFFAGLFDSDGYNSMDKKNVCLSLIDYNFLWELKKQLQKFGYIIRLSEKLREGYCSTYNLSFVGMASLKKLQEVDSIKIREGNLFGKYDRLKTPYRAKSLNLDYNLYRDINGEEPISDSKYTKYLGSKCDLYIQKIVSIEPAEESITYDITVDSDDHLFSAHSILVKNSGRIPAFLFSISCDHPDVEEFIQIKKDYTRIQNANISVQMTEKFYRALEKDEDWEMKFEVPPIKKGDKVYVDVHSIDKDCTKEKETGRYYRIATHDRKKQVFTKTVKAKKLMELIAKNMHSNAEPGIQNIDLARKYSNSDALYDPEDEYDARIIGTNACSEQYLSRDSLCVLSSINCEKFSALPEIYFGQLEKIGRSVNRFLDNVNECELLYQTFATPHQKLAIQKLRRTGAGVTNIAAWLFKQNLVYATQEANNVFEEFMKIYNYWLYVNSEEVGQEKGNFGLFSAEKWKKANFVARVMEESKKIAEKYKSPVLKGNSARNVTCSSIAPVGTLTLMFRDTLFSYGIEPAFFLYYWKRTRMAGKYEYYFNVPKVVKDAFATAGFPIPMESDTVKDTWDGSIGMPVAKFIEENKEKAGIKFKTSTEISAMDKLNFMSQVMKWVDSSISVTYMLPEDSTWKDVYNFIIEAHNKEVKSISAFPDKKMYGIVSQIPFKELAVNLIKDGINIHHQNFGDDELKFLNISREDIKETHSFAPKRLQSLDADIYSVSVKNEKFCIVIGIQNGKPYEIFGGHLNGLNIKSNFKRGKIIKIKRSQYALEFDDIYIEDFSKQFTPTEQILFRMTSTSLRHGVPLLFVIQQLQKATDDITSMAAAAARCLKKYVKDGEKVCGQSCPTCNGELVYMEGCVTCSSCGWSKCS